MERNIFITGFPGFVGSKVIETLLNEKALSYQNDKISVTALVQPEFYDKAVQDISAYPGKAKNSITLVRGDLCEEKLGLPEKLYESLRGSINEIMHIAALYRLDVRETLAEKVNVDGTRIMLHFASDIKKLRVFSHISTIIVSGKRKGKILEEELYHNEGFHNHYESTKYKSEVLVREFADKIPVSIYRPGVVAGDSKTGDIPKFDGPYYTIKSYLKAGFLPKIMVPVFGNYSNAFFNMAPVDYIAEALVYISRKKEAIGKTFHLTDKNPLTTHELFGLIHDKVFGEGKAIPLSRGAVKMLGKMPVWAGKALGFSRGGAAYLDHPAIYDTKNAEELLKGSKIKCPCVYDYIDIMIDYVRNHPDVPLSI